MPIDVTTSTQSMTAAQAAQSSSVNQTATNNRASDSSFQEEMTKVSESENKETKSTTEKKETSEKSVKKEEKTVKNEKETITAEKDVTQDVIDKKAILNNADDSDRLHASLLFNQMTINDANSMLSNDIAQVIETNLNSNNIARNSIWSLSFGENSKTSNNISMNETDAQFFINLTQDNNVSMQTITAQAQNMINNGADNIQVSQNFKVSQALLNALSESRQNNQPIRIDFDQNMSVILRVGKDGAISANFIPGDKAVEQYLKNNIESLKNAFDEQDLNYAELTYSNSSKEQNHKRREEKRQGE